MKTLDCLILDLGGVLSQAQLPEKISELEALLGFRGSRQVFSAAYAAVRSDYDRGLLRGEGYWAKVAQSLRLPVPDPETMTKLIRADQESWFSIRPAMLDFLERSRPRLARLVLLSNIHEDGVRFLRSGQSGSWPGYFDELVLSCEHKLMKPEPAIYALAVKKAGVRPEAALFVDDLQANVEGALAAGLQSFRFVGEEDFLGRLAAEYGL